MKLLSLLKEVLKSPEDAIEYLKGLAQTGELDIDTIHQIHTDLLSSRRKMFSNKRSPEQKSSSAQKAQLTRQLNKIKDKAQDEAEIELGLSKPGAIQTATKAAMTVKLSMGSGAKELQQKYNKIMIDKIKKAAREAGITDQEAIKNAYYYQDPTQWL